MEENPEYMLEPLDVGADFKLYRVREDGSQSPILPVAAAVRQASPQNVRQLGHKHSLAPNFGILGYCKGRMRRLVLPTATLSLFLFLWCTYALAKNPDLHATQQIMEQSWSFQQGAPQRIRAIAQTADGFLWLGGEGGLFRFDGTRFERFRPFSGDRLFSSNISTLFAPPTGGLWVGYLFGGFGFVNNGRVTNYGGIAASSSGTVYTLAQDSKGTMWAGTGSGVWRFDGSKWRKLGAEWGAPMDISNLGIDRTDTVWVIAGFSNRQKLLYLLPGSRRFQVANPNLDDSEFILDVNQKVLTSPMAMQQAPNPKSVPQIQSHVYPLFAKNGVQIVDQTNAVWTVSESGGLTRIGTALPAHDAVTERGKKIRGTYGVGTWREVLHGTLIDREGNIWFADMKGLHRFFCVPFFLQKLPVKRSAAIAADDDGAVWVSFFKGPTETSNELYRVTRGQVETIHFRNPINWGAAYRASDKTFWFGGVGGLWHLIRGKPLQVALPKQMAAHAFYLQAITEDRRGGLWISFGRYGLFRFANGVWTSFAKSEDLSGAGPLVEFTDSHGRLWFGYSGFKKNRLALLDGDKVHLFGTGNGAPVGNVTAISGRGSDVWIGSEFGLEKFDGERFYAIHAVDDDWLLGISGIVERANGDLWLNGISGIFRIGQSEIAEALKDPSYRVKGQHLGARDGLPGVAAQIRPTPTVIEGSDGRLWFSETSGLVWLDPNRARHQAVVPPVSIQSVSADDKTYEAKASPTLPAHTSSVGISYSAISLSDPESVRSRVRLHETDTDWHEITTIGPVVYRNLPPGHYHFSVEASDTDGVWSGKVANVDFTILPAWYQTNWFRLLCVVLFAGLLWMLYQLRVRSIQRRSKQLAVINTKLETQIAENAILYSDLQLQVGLLQLLPVSAWTLKPDGTPDFVNQVWLDFAGQTPDFIRSHPEAWMTAVHPEDRESAARSFWEGVHSGRGFAFETRSLRNHDGTYRWHLQQAVVLRDSEGKVLKFVGTTTDIDDQKRIEEALRQAQGDLARINRVTTMGELAASLAHEISQPLSGVITNAAVSLRRLGHDKPDIEELRVAVTRIVRDAQRAAEILARIRSQFEKGALDREVLDGNQIILETIALLRDQAVRHNISVRTELAPDLPQVVGDRVQLQQVAMNLIVNSIEAMKDVDGIRALVIQSQRAEKNEILVSFCDTGIGLPPELAGQIFDPFFTTKVHGTGMGLRICRSIIESHGGRLWVVGSQGRGATFHFSLPITIPSSEKKEAPGAVHAESNES